MKEILPPLLEDFQDWFSRTLNTLEAYEMGFLTEEEQDDLIDRITDAKKHVCAAQAISAATDNQAVVDMPVMMAWHKLLNECWGVAIRLRKELVEAGEIEEDEDGDDEAE